MPKSKLPLPIDINPVGRHCVMVRVPDEPYHRAAFWGVLFELSKGYSWQDDTAHTAKLVANVWKDVYHEARANEGHCMATIYRMDSCGVIEFKVDSGAWETLADFSNCFIWRLPPNAARNLIEAQGNFSGLGIKRHSGQTAPLLPLYDNSDTLMAWIDKNGAYRRKLWGNGAEASYIGGELFGFNLEITDAGDYAKTIANKSAFGLRYISPTSNKMSIVGMRTSHTTVSTFLEHFFEGDFRVTQALGTFRTNSPQSGAANALKGDAAGSVTFSLELVSGQTANLHNNYDAVGNILSGIDKYGFYYNRLSNGQPTQSDARNGAIAADIANMKLWVKFASGWVAINQQGPQGIQGIQGIPGENGQGIENVYVDFVEWDMPGGATLEGTALYLTIPKGKPGENGQPGAIEGGDSPTVGQCFTIDFTVRASQRTLIPIPIQDGWTATLRNAAGAWSYASEIAAAWYCWTGYQFVLGACQASYPAGNAGSEYPAPGYRKYCLILTGDNAPTGKPLMLDSAIDVEGGDGQFFLQMNDTDLTDNQGEITCTVEFCYGASTVGTIDYDWELVFNLLTYDPTGVYDVSYRTQGPYTSGWTNGRGIGGIGVYEAAVNIGIQPSPDGAWYSKRLIVEGENVNPSGTGFTYITQGGVHNSPGTGIYTTELEYIDGPYTATIHSLTGFGFYGPDYPGNPGGVWLRKFRIQGTGHKPTLVV